MKIELALAVLCMGGMLSGCNGKQEGELKTIDIDLKECKSLHIDPSHLVSLEVNDSSAVYEIWFAEEIGGNIIVGSRSLSKIFDGKTGKYIGNFSIKGEGPGEYLSLSQLWADVDTVRIYDSTGKKLLSYLSDGTLVSTNPVSSQINFDTNSQPIYLIRSPYGDGGYFSANSWWGGTAPNNPKYSHLDINLNIINDIPGRECTDGNFAPDMMTIDEKNKRILAWDQLRDTIFSVSDDGVVPLFAITYGEKTFPSECQAIPSFYERTQKFLENKDARYASMMKHVQTNGDNLYFSFITSDDKAYIARFNMNTGDSQVFKLESENDRYAQQMFFKLYGDTLMIALKDREIIEANPAIYKLPISELD